MSKEIKKVEVKNLVEKNGGVTQKSNSNTLNKLLQFIASKIKKMPIENGGTGATSVTGALNNFGIKDKIIEYNSSGVFRYWKFSTGRFIAWGEWSPEDSIDTWSQTGTMYSTKEIKVPLPDINITSLTGRSISCYGNKYILPVDLVWDKNYLCFNLLSWTDEPVKPVCSIIIFGNYQ